MPRMHRVLIANGVLLPMRERKLVVNRRWELMAAPAGEAMLIFAAGLVAWLSRSPMLFASLGPTAYELVETPERPSARTYNVLVGHGAGVLSAWVALLVLQQWRAPQPPDGHVNLMRVLVATVASLLTVLLTLVLCATQPAAVATALVVALGSSHHLRDGLLMMVAIVMVRLLGEPIRRWRLRGSI